MGVETRKFLKALVDAGGVCKPTRLRVPASRQQDRARQAAKRAGLVDYDGCWNITKAGREALAAASGGGHDDAVSL